MEPETSFFQVENVPITFITIQNNEFKEKEPESLSRMSTTEVEQRYTLTLNQCKQQLGTFVEALDSVPERKQEHEEIEQLEGTRNDALNQDEEKLKTECLSRVFVVPLEKITEKGEASKGMETNQRMLRTRKRQSYFEDQYKDFEFEDVEDIDLTDDNALTNTQRQSATRHKKVSTLVGTSTGKNSKTKKHRKGAGSTLKKKKRSPTMRIRDKFRCRVGGCMFRGNDLDELKEHRFQIHGRNDVRVYKYICEVSDCGFRTMFEDNMNSHRLTHTTNSANQSQLNGNESTIIGINDGKKGRNKFRFPCPVEGCKRVLVSGYNLRIHLTSVHKKEVKFAECTFNLSNRRKKQMARLKGKRDDRKLNENSNELENSSNDLEENQVTNMEEGETNKNENFNEEDSLSWLTATRHPNYPIKKLPCQHCFLTFAYQDKLEAHMRERHPGLKANPKGISGRFTKIPWEPTDILCLSCGEKFDNVIQLRVHIKIHYRKDQIFKCRLCARLFRTGEMLRLHFQSVHLGMPRRNDFKRKLKRWKDAGLDTTELEKEQAKFRDSVCDVCGKKFYLQYRLTEHKLRHHGNGQDKSKCVRCIPCNVCGRLFRTLYEVEKHLRTHSTEKSFICHICGRPIKHAENLRTHVRKVHPEHYDSIPKGNMYDHNVSTEVPYPLYSNIPSVAPPSVFSREIENEELGVVPQSDVSKLHQQSLSDLVSDGDHISLREISTAITDTDTETKPIIEEEALLNLSQLNNHSSKIICTTGASYAEETLPMQTNQNIEDGLRNDHSHELYSLHQGNEEDDLEQIIVKPEIFDEDEDYKPIPSPTLSEAEEIGRLRRSTRQLLLRQRKARMKKLFKNKKRNVTNTNISTATADLEDSVFLDDDPSWNRSARRPSKPRKRKPETRIKCRLGDCKFRADSIEELSSHRLEVHGRNDLRVYKYRCEVTGCTFRSLSAESLQIHVNQRHKTGGAMDDEVLENSAEGEGLGDELTGEGGLQRTKRKRKPDTVIRCRLSGCTFRAESLEVLAKHRSEVHGRNDLRIYKYKCQEAGCNFRARFEDSFEAHRRKHITDKLRPPITEPKRERYPCWFENCSKVFTRRLKLVEHVAAVHNKKFDSGTTSTNKYTSPCSTANISNKASDDPDRFRVKGKCRRNGCKFSTWSKKVMEKHRIDIHGCTQQEAASRNLSTNWIYCGIGSCEFRCLNKERLEAHHSTVHENIPKVAVYKCAHCPKEFRSISYRQIHCRLHHGIISSGTSNSDTVNVNFSKVKCELCPKEFHTKAFLNQHMWNSHPKAPKDKCEICSAEILRYSNCNDLQRHMDRHEAQVKEPYRCVLPNCCENFNSIDELRGHVENEHKKVSMCDRVVCSTCAKSVSMRFIAIHEAKHRGDLNFKHKCKFCTKSFYKKQYLDRHYETTHGQEAFGNKAKEFSCEYCGNMYWTRISLAIHVYRHKKPKPSKTKDAASKPENGEAAILKKSRKKRNDAGISRKPRNQAKKSVESCSLEAASINNEDLTSDEHDDNEGEDESTQYFPVSNLANMPTSTVASSIITSTHYSHHSSQFPAAISNWYPSYQQVSSSQQHHLVSEQQQISSVVSSRSVEHTRFNSHPAPNHFQYYPRNYY